MNFLVVGLGSMGKRRIRCLQTLGYSNVYGFDVREDRRTEAEDKYGIQTFGNFIHAVEVTRPNALIISVPPDIHHEYMKKAIDHHIHFFVEASVVDTNMSEIINQLQTKNIVAAPSSTLYFHPAIQKIKELATSGYLGKISNILYHSGQYLPDWHTYEHVSDYYVSNPATGGAREIVPFELTWLTEILGMPSRVCGNVRKTIQIEGAESIDDTYNALLDYEEFLVNLTVDVVSRCATRRLLINGDKKQLRWDWDMNSISIFNPDSEVWETMEYEMSGAEQGYNPNIGENMYIDEIRAFIQAINGEQEYVNSLEKDHQVLKVLYAIEESDKTSTYVRLEL